MLPPSLMLEVPLDGLLDAVLEFRLRLPAELRVDLRRVDGVAAVVALASVTYSMRSSELPSSLGWS